jgi:probable O-glycosylation ligase (exosortase A-associated)
VDAVLRNVFVWAVIVYGAVMAVQTPLYALMFYLWIAYFRPESWVWTPYFMSLNLSYIAGAFLVFRTLLSRIPVFLDLRTALLFAILFHSGVSSALSVDPEFSFLHFWAFAKSLLITYLIAVIAVDGASLRWIIVAIVVSLSFETAKQGWAQLLLNPGAPNINQIPFLGDNNLVAVGMMMLLPMVVALSRTAGSRAEAWVFRLIAVGVLYRSVSTFSRGGFLAAAVVGLIFVLRSKRRGVALIGGALAATAVLSAMPDTFWSRMQTIQIEGESLDASAAGRLHFWRIGWVMAQDNPFAGVGHNAYNRAYDQYDDSAGRYGISRSVHSAWFGITAELGFVGLALLVLQLGLAWAACRRAQRLAARGAISPELREFAVGIETALAAFAVGSAFVIFQYVEMLWHYIGLSIALHRIMARETAERAEPRPVKVAAPIAASTSA